ncbi:hypothetical protein ABPG74_018912 [Tetrahymena malaccensis]
MFQYILVAVIIYYTVSYFFLKNAQYLTLPKKKLWNNELINQALSNQKILKIAHRGGSREQLENTIEAFDNALSLGSDMLELDVRVTKDDKVVVVHDNKLRRLCGVNKNIEDLQYSEIPKFKKEIDLHFSPNGQFKASNYECMRMPLLEEVFQKYQNTLINIEIKNPLEKNIQLVNDLIVKFKREDLTIWGCKNYKMSQRLKQVNPKIKRFFSFTGVLAVLKLFALGLLPFAEIDEDAFEIPIYNKQHYEWKFIKKYPLNKTLFNIFYFIFLRVAFGHFIGDALFQHLKKRGVLVLFWVINDIPTLNQALSYKGCAGVMTDLPSLLSQNINDSQKKTQ